MTDTLNVTTMIGVPVATSASGIFLTDTATAYETDKEGNVTESKLKPKGVIASSAAMTFTTAAYVIQETEEKKTLAEINQAQEVVESMSDEELENALIALELLEAPESSDINTKTL